VLGERVPEPEPVGPAGDVVAHGVVRVRDPERRRVAVARQQAVALGGLAGAEPEVALQHVLGLLAVLEEEAVAEVVVARVPGHAQPVGPVDGHAPVEGVVEARPLEIGALAARAEHVEVDPIAT